MDGSDQSRSSEPFYRPPAEACPADREESFVRVQFYISRLALVASDHLLESVMTLRRKAYGLTDQLLQQLALKGFTDEEYCAAVKEVLCVWLHLEVIDQGGNDAPDWLLKFLRVAFRSSDYLVESPSAVAVMEAYGDCEDYPSLCSRAALKVCAALGFGVASEVFVSYILPVLKASRPLRQQVLEKALSWPLEKIQRQDMKDLWSG